MTSSGGERAVPYYCPYCGGEDLRPHVESSDVAGRDGEDKHGAWECRECTRVFSVSLLGLRVRPGVGSTDVGAN
jgi:hypothetical protein